MKIKLILAGCFVFLCSALSMVWFYNQALGLGHSWGYSIAVGIAFGLYVLRYSWH